MIKLRFCIIIILTLTTTSLLFAQTKNNTKNKYKLPSECFYIKFNNLKFIYAGKLPFSKIILSDNRFDTTKLGYINDNKWSKNYKLCMQGNFHTEVSTFLNKYLDSNFSQTEDVVFACIRNLSNRIFIPEETEIRKSKEKKYNLSLKIEFYLKKQSDYYPLYRFDSTLTYILKTKEDINEQISNSFIASTHKLLNPSVFNIQNGKSLSYQQIDSFNNKSKNIPLLLQEVAQKGVYLTFEQFKENKPAYKNFEISLSESVDILYIKGQTIKDSVITDSWGFSDGKNMFIRQKSNFFPLLRVCNNFEFLGFDKSWVNQPFPFSPSPPYSDIASATTDIAINGLLSLIRSSKTNLQPYYLDMESGKIYQSYEISH